MLLHSAVSLLAQDLVEAALALISSLKTILLLTEMVCILHRIIARLEIFILEAKMPCKSRNSRVVCPFP